MNRQFLVDHRHRLQLLRALDPPVVNGIDYLEIASKNQLKLKVVLVNPAVGLSAAHCRISGGVRITNIKVVGFEADGRTLTITVDHAGDFSWYLFELINPAAPEQPPSDFDPCLSALRFSFKAQCPSEFDCADNSSCLPEQALEPLLDYLAKDYASFRRLLLDRMSQLLPQPVADQPADLTIAMVELLAYVGDQLSYYQDAVATEAYLGTARRRVSLRRHARLLDYPIDEGCNARVFIALGVAGGADNQQLPAGTPFLTRSEQGELVVGPHTLERLPDGETQVFESCHDLLLRAAHNQIPLHSWGAPHYCLPAGSTAAALVATDALALQPGMVLVVEEIISPHTGLAADAERRHRHPVRLVAVSPGHDPLTNTPLLLVRWHQDDALPFSLCVTAAFAQGASTEVRQVAVARANVVLADHGLSRHLQPLVPAVVPAAGGYQPRLAESGLAFAEPYDHARAVSEQWSARQTLIQDARRALPVAMSLVADDPALVGDQPEASALYWTPQRDLLASDRFAREFVAEPESDGQIYLRFGDGRHGQQPVADSRLLASYRLGGGTVGNVGADSISRVLTSDAAIAPFLLWVRNPLPASGGSDGESHDAIRLKAPEMFRQQQRAVTADDYARMAERHPQVQRAAARLRWTGSWYTVFISVDRRGGQPLDPALRAELLGHLQQYRLAGYDLELCDPVHVPLDLAFTLCISPGYFASAVKAAVLVRLGASVDGNGQPAFFHPDHFTFGQGLALSSLLAAIHEVAGVASVSVGRFQRWGKSANGELQAGWLAVSPLEVVRLDNDPSFPENGRLQLTTRGGL